MSSYLQYTRLLVSLYDFFIEQIIDKFQIAKYFWNKSLYLDFFYLNIECRSQVTALFAFISQFCVCRPIVVSRLLRHIWDLLP